MRKRATKTVTFRTTPEQHCHLTELSRLHGGITLSAIIRRLLDQELVRIGLCQAPQTLRVRGRRRHAV